MLKKLLSFTFLHKNQTDTPMPGGDTPTGWKTKLDSQAEQLQTTVNTLIDDLGATTAGDSGAKAIGVSTIAGVTGNNVQAVLEDIKLQVNEAVTGAIPPGSITQDKLAFTIATDAASVSIADTGAHFTATNVEGALDELFLSASSVKTNVANAIGAPATSSDTGTVLAGRITTEKGRLSAEIGDGDNTSALQYLADRLIVRSDAIATVVNSKGVAATSADTLAQLATKIGQIVTAPRSPGDNQQVKTAGGSTNSTVYTVVGLPITFANAGTYRFKFDLRPGSNVLVYGRFFNVTTGSYIGTERSTNSLTAVNYAEDLAIAASNKIELRLKTSNATYAATTDNIIVATAEPSMFLVG